MTAARKLKSELVHAKQSSAAIQQYLDEMVGHADQLESCEEMQLQASQLLAARRQRNANQDKVLFYQHLGSIAAWLTATEDRSDPIQVTVVDHAHSC